MKIGGDNIDDKKYVNLSLKTCNLQIVISRHSSNLSVNSLYYFFTIKYGPGKGRVGWFL